MTATYCLNPIEPNNARFFGIPNVRCVCIPCLPKCQTYQCTQINPFLTNFPNCVANYKPSKFLLDCDYRRCLQREIDTCLPITRCNEARSRPVRCERTIGEHHVNYLCRKLAIPVNKCHKKRENANYPFRKQIRRSIPSDCHKKANIVCTTRNESEVSSLEQSVEPYGTAQVSECYNSDDDQAFEYMEGPSTSLPISKFSQDYGNLHSPETTQNVPRSGSRSAIPVVQRRSTGSKKEVREVNKKRESNTSKQKSPNIFAGPLRSHQNTGFKKVKPIVNMTTPAKRNNGRDICKIPRYPPMVFNNKIPSSVSCLTTQSSVKNIPIIGISQTPRYLTHDFNEKQTNEMISHHSTMTCLTSHSAIKNIPIIGVSQTPRYPAQVFNKKQTNEMMSHPSTMTYLTTQSAMKNIPIIGVSQTHSNLTQSFNKKQTNEMMSHPSTMTYLTTQSAMKNIPIIGVSETHSNLTQGFNKKQTNEMMSHPSTMTYLTTQSAMKNIPIIGVSQTHSNLTQAFNTKQTNEMMTNPSTMTYLTTQSAMKNIPIVGVSQIPSNPTQVFNNKQTNRIMTSPVVTPDTRYNQTEYRENYTLNQKWKYSPNPSRFQIELGNKTKNVPCEKLTETPECYPAYCLSPCTPEAFQKGQCYEICDLKCGIKEEVPHSFCTGRMYMNSRIHSNVSPVLKQNKQNWCINPYDRLYCA